VFALRALSERYRAAVFCHSAICFAICSLATAAVVAADSAIFVSAAVSTTVLRTVFERLIVGPRRALEKELLFRRYARCHTGGNSNISPGHVKIKSHAKARR
jgi:hypothetical protein